jgi:hypothetical protein
MTAISITPGYPTFADTDGSPLNDGYVYIGLENQDPITAPTGAFWDKEFQVPADQPLRTSGGYIVRNGTPAAVYTGASYSILVQNKNLVTVYNAPSAVITNVTNNVEEITQYQGAHATDPIARNDGTPLEVGDLYFNTVINELKVWTGTDWVPASPGAITVQNFTGTGAQTAFNLATAPVAENNTQIYIDGVYQQKDTYTVAGATINFSTAPPNLSGIEVVTFSIAALGTVDASNVSYNEGSLGAVNTSVQAKLQESVSVKDFGAAGDGVTDDTAAINAAIAASESIYFPPGNYVITNTIYTRGEFDGIWWRGKRLFGAGSESTTITAAVGFTDSVMIHIGNKDYLTDSKFCIKNELSGMTINNYNMLNTASDAGVLTFGTYDNRLSDLAIISLAYPFTRWDLAIDKGTYTTIVDNVHCQNLQVASATVGDVTTISFYGCSATFVNVVNGVAINFDHLTVQGTYSGVYQQNRIQISNSVNVAFLNGDIEGDGVAFNIANSVGVEITGNNVAIPGSYTTSGGVTENSKWIVLDGCSQVRSQGNIFLNWVKGPSAPAPGTYLVETGTNSKLDLIDFNGDTYTGASYARADAQVLTDAANVIINYDSSIYDSGTYYLVSYAPSVFTGTNLVTTGAAWKFTCPISGVYAVSASAVIAAFAQATDYAFITINVNGVEKFRMWNGSPVFSGILSLAIQGSVYCDIDDYIDIRITCDGAAERSLSAAATGNRVNIDYIGTF